MKVVYDIPHSYMYRAENELDEVGGEEGELQLEVEGTI